MNKLIYKQIRAGFPITLHQTGLERFTVRYGLQERTNLTYVAAAKELGECIMHGLTNEGKLSEK